MTQGLPQTLVLSLSFLFFPTKSIICHIFKTLFICTTIPPITQARYLIWWYNHPPNYLSQVFWISLNFLNSHSLHVSYSYLSSGPQHPSYRQQQHSFVTALTTARFSPVPTSSSYTPQPQNNPHIILLTGTQYGSSLSTGQSASTSSHVAQSLQVSSGSCPAPL